MQTITHNPVDLNFDKLIGIEMANPKESFITPKDEYITLGQLLKLLDEVSSGSEVKDYLAEMIVFVNGEEENRRGKKLRPGDTVLLPGNHTVNITD